MQSLKLIVKINNLYWTCEVESNLGIFHTAKRYDYSFGNAAEINVTPESSANEAITDLHAFIIESFRNVAITFSQLRDVSCQYTLVFGTGKADIEFSHSATPNQIWKGELYLGEQCVPAKGSTSESVHPAVYRDFDWETFDTLYRHVDEARFSEHDAVISFMADIAERDEVISYN